MKEKNEDLGKKQRSTCCSVIVLCLMLWTAVCLTTACGSQRATFDTRGVVVSWLDCKDVDWPLLVKKNGLNTLTSYVYPEAITDFWMAPRGRKLLEQCSTGGLTVQFQYTMGSLLPRYLFQEDSTMFRMNEEGRRTADYNCCVSSTRALDIIAEHALRYARLFPSRNHRYYYWTHDGAPVCHCPGCRDFSPSEQALIYENRIAEELRKRFDKDALVSHLCYANAIEAPRKVKPADGVFLQFAPFCRSIEWPLNDSEHGDRGMMNSDNLRYLDDNLKVFSAETAIVLDYWLDASLVSLWKKPAVRLPWKSEVLRKDLEEYASRGIRNVETYAVYLDSVYFKTYPETYDVLRDYGKGFRNVRVSEK